MSRSYKKHPFIKDPHAVEKRLASRRYRRIIRQRVKPWKDRYTEWSWECECEYDYDYEDEFAELKQSCLVCRKSLEPVLPHPFEITHPYDVCDWKSNPYKPRYRRIGVDPRDKRK